MLAVTSKSPSALGLTVSENHVPTREWSHRAILRRALERVSGTSWECPRPCWGADTGTGWPWPAPDAQRARARAGAGARPYFSESRAMSALSKVSFPGPCERPGAGFPSPTGPVGSKPSGTRGAVLCGLSSSESRGPAALREEERNGGPSVRDTEDPPSHGNQWKRGLRFTRPSNRASLPRMKMASDSHPLCSALHGRVQI